MVVGSNTCQYKIHYCVKVWNDGMITRYSYQYWLENVGGGCSFSTLSQSDITDLYSRASQLIAEINPERLKYLPCDLPMEHQTTMDISHASCVWEDISPNGGLGSIDPPTYKYNPCPGAGICYERYDVCEACLYGKYSDPNTGQLYCKDPLPGMQPNPVSARLTASWTTNTNCATEFYAGGYQRPCYPICSSNAPPVGNIGMIDSDNSSASASQSVQTLPQQAVTVENRNDAMQR